MKGWNGLGSTDGYLARYRLSPQFPFPCGILDCLAAYLYLLTVQDPTTIVLAGDSAGGGMVLRSVRLFSELWHQHIITLYCWCIFADKK
jgi:acetyl esterase/lipase